MTKDRLSIVRSAIEPKRVVQKKSDRVYEAEEIMIHENYDPETLANNVGLIKLSETIEDHC